MVAVPFEPVALALGLDDPAPVGEPVESGAGEALRSEDLGPGLEGQIARDDQTGALVRGRYDVEEKLGADLGGRDVAQLIKNKKVQLGQLPLEAQEGPFVACLDEGGHQFGGAEEPDPVAVRTRLGGESRSQ